MPQPILFEVDGGFSDGVVHYLNSVGAPGGDASYQDAAPIGSYCSDSTNGDTYKKIAAGAGTGPSIWRREATTADLTGLSASQSWREPAQVLDTVSADTATALVGMDATDTIDGVALASGDRILFTAIPQATGGGSNVYIVGGATGAWSLTEDINQETNGDTLQVLSGTHANEIWMFNGSWSWIGANSSSEESFLRAYIGKSAAGGVMPAFTSVNYVANGDALDIAVGKLDAAAAQIAAQVTGLSASSGATQTELNTVKAASGLAADGSFVAYTATNFLNASTTLAGAIALLDTQAGTQSSALTTEISNRTAAVGALQTEVNAIELSVGLNPDGTYSAHTASTYLNGATSVKNAFTLLDTQLTTTYANLVSLTSRVVATEASLASDATLLTQLRTDTDLNTAGLAQEILDRTAQDNLLNGKIGSVSFAGAVHVAAAADLTSAIVTLDTALDDAVHRVATAGVSNGVVDSLPVSTGSTAHWMVSCTDPVNAANGESMIVFARHNGTATTTPTRADFTRMARVRTGSGIAGLVVNTSITGAGAAANTNLVLSGNAPFDVKVVRMYA